MERKVLRNGNGDDFSATERHHTYTLLEHTVKAQGSSHYVAKAQSLLRQGRGVGLIVIAYTNIS